MLLATGTEHFFPFVRNLKEPDMATRGFKQDMAPPGGYDPIQIARKLPKKVSGYTLAAAYFGVMGLGLFQFFYMKTKERNRICFSRDVHIAMEPILRAEQQRSYLKYLRKSREEEAEVMGDIIGWNLGMFYEIPVYYYKDVRPHKIHEIELFSHSDAKEIKKYRPA